MTRATDLLLSIIACLVFGPVIGILALLVWLQDHQSPLYRGPRAGRGQRVFAMNKLRSMMLDADESGVDSTAEDDERITRIGRFMRRYKLDELPQFWNVLRGDMSLVGPRPNILRAVRGYTNEEMHLMDVRPGITDIASIVFSDEGEILRGSDDPDAVYEKKIRPWKSRLALIYAKDPSPVLYFRILYWTALSLLNRASALMKIEEYLIRNGVDPILCRIAGRGTSLNEISPP